MLEQILISIGQMILVFVIIVVYAFSLTSALNPTASIGEIINHWKRTYNKNKRQTTMK